MKASELKIENIGVTGIVQGVGFRFTAESIASQLGLTGWVKNLSDGRVEAICEGDEEKLNEFLGKVKNSALKHYIRNIELEWLEASSEFKSFGLRFW